MTRQFPFSFQFLSFLCWCALTLGGLSPPKSHAQAVTPEVAADASSAAPSLGVGTPRQQEWLNTPIKQRPKLAEQIGEDGARAFARSKGWQPLFDGTERGIPYGPDQIYQDNEGIVHVVEAKGGGSKLAHGYGHPQATSEWSVESTKRWIKSPGASPAQREAAKVLLEAASHGKSQVHVVRTTHVLGEPSATVLEQTVRCSDTATRLAACALDELGGTCRAAEAALPRDGIARTAVKGGSLLKTTAKAAIPVAVVLDGGLRVRDGLKTEEQFAASEITVQKREVAHAKNAAGMAGGWAGAWAGAEVGAAGGAAAGSLVAPGLGTAIGGVVGGVTGGVAGYVGGEAAAEPAAEWAVTRIHNAGSTIAGSLDAAWQRTAGSARSISKWLCAE
jgi:hypothetical protein